MFAARTSLRDRHPSVDGARRVTVFIGALAVTLAGDLARPVAANAQPRALSAWTVAACRIEIERRGWRIDANESDGGYSDGWVWFRVATDPTGSSDQSATPDPAATTDALCGEAPNGGITLNVLSAATGGSGDDVSADFLASCGTELERRGWKRAGGASTARSGGTILVQYVLKNANGADGVGHCVYDAAAPADSAATNGAPSNGKGSTPVPTAVSAEVVRPALAIDAVCQEVFQQLGWLAVKITDPNGASPDRARYEVTSRRGSSPRDLVCRYDRTAETVRIDMVKK